MQHKIASISNPKVPVNIDISSLASPDVGLIKQALALNKMVLVNYISQIRNALFALQTHGPTYSLYFLFCLSSLQLPSKKKRAPLEHVKYFALIICCFFCNYHCFSVF